MKRRSGLSAAVAVLGLLPGAVVASAQTTDASTDQARIEKQLEEGKKALSEGKYEAALRAFTKADEHSGGGSTIALLGLSAAHLRLSHCDEAVLQAESAIAMTSRTDEEAVAYNLLGTALLRKYETTPLIRRDDREASLARAVESLREAVDFSEGQISIAWSSLALALERQGNLEEARNVLSEYLSREPDDGSAKQRLAQIEATLAWKARTTQAIADGKLFKARGDGAIVPPEKISAPPPRYPEKDRKAQIEGTVVIGAIIDEAGRVTEVAILKGLSGSLNEAAADAARKWKFEPASLDSQPVPVLLHLTISFRLAH